MSLTESLCTDDVSLEVAVASWFNTPIHYLLSVDNLKILRVIPTKREQRRRVYCPAGCEQRDTSDLETDNPVCSKY